MQVIHNLEFRTGSKEEKLPGFGPEFPYIASRAELDHYRDFCVPWHWHKAVELFYMESGELRYHTPGGRRIPCRIRRNDQFQCAAHDRGSLPHGEKCTASSYF